MARRVVLLTTTAAAVAATFLPALHYPFLNWDDNLAIVGNAALRLPGAARWAFTTTLLEHYQPLSWLIWSATATSAGISAAAFHSINLAAHIVCTLLVWATARTVLGRAYPSLPSRACDAGATAAAALYGLHPLRVEVVAWVSALPYAVALAFLLASTVLWLRGTSGPRSSLALLLSLTLYAASLAARPVSVGFPIVLVVIDTWLNGRTLRASTLRALPFALLAGVAAAAEFFARSGGLTAVPWLYRLQSATAAPFVYLWRTVLPVGLTPLDVMPLRPEGNALAVAAATAGLVVVSVAAWRLRRRYPAFAVVWVSYLALLAPAIGLVPGGLQATADRYSYVPAVVIAIAVGGAGARWSAARRERAVIAGSALVVMALACAAASREALRPWKDSVSLWTRVVALDPTNDVGLYNLAQALAADGHADEAAARYRDVLAIVPAHADARANLDRLDAARLEREGNDLAGSGEFAAAADRYAQALARDPNRTHSHAARGMALSMLGRSEDALAELREAIRQGESDPAAANALGVLLLQTGEIRDARVVFETALASHPEDLNLAHNLARLLVTGAAPTAADAALALRLSRAVVDATGGRDARALETLASALAANGRLAEADDTNARAAGVAAAAGDRDLAVQITARRRAYRSTGR